MSPADPFPLVAVDIGNSRIKLGVFDASPPPGRLPEPDRTLLLETGDWDPIQVALWLAPVSPAAVGWHVATVDRPAAARFAEWLAGETAGTSPRRLTCRDLPLEVELAEPQAVGIDRLLAAVAANTLRQGDRPAVIVDLGSAITIDLVSHAGAFRGGAILPGIGMGARALAEFTDLLPHVDTAGLDRPPEPLGTSTTTAITSGLYWGATGAIRELLARLGEQEEEPPEVFLTGGAAPEMAKHIGPQVRYEPHLVLAGIVLSAQTPPPGTDAV